MFLVKHIFIFMSIPLDFKPFGIRIEFNNMECSSDKREPFEIEIPIEKKDVFMYLCEKQSDFNPENVLKDYLELKKNTMAFNGPMIYYYRFFVAINVEKNIDKCVTAWQEVTIHFFEYFLGIRYHLQNDDFVLKPKYLCC